MTENPDEDDHIIRHFDPEEPGTETVQSLGAEAVGDALEQHKKSLAGFLGHFNSTLKNAKTICITDSSQVEILREALESLNLAWDRYYENYISKVWVRKSLIESWKDTWKQVPSTVNAHMHLKTVCFN